MKDEEFRVLLDLCMVSDPWPLSVEANNTLIEMLNRESIHRGYESWVVAYHRFPR